MDALALAQRYFDGWNAHDADAIAATFAPGGTYSEPTIRDLDGPATGAYAFGIASAFPDLRYFELANVSATGGGGVAAEWVMRGTNSLPGDHRERRRAGRDQHPRLEARSDEEVAEVRARSREIATGILDAAGFISFVGVVVGRRMYTMTAWATAADARQIRAQPAHREAVGRFFGPDLAAGAGVWIPEHLNGQHVRCTACGKMARAGDACPCGAALPAPPVFW